MASSFVMRQGGEADLQGAKGDGEAILTPLLPHAVPLSPGQVIQTASALGHYSNPLHGGGGATLSSRGPPVPEPEGIIDYQSAWVVPSAVPVPEKRTCNSPAHSGGAAPHQRRPSCGHESEMNGPFKDAERLGKQREREAQAKIWRAHGNALSANEREMALLSMGERAGVARDREGLAVDPDVHGAVAAPLPLQPLPAPSAPPQKEEKEQGGAAAGHKGEERRGRGSSVDGGASKTADEGYRIGDYKPMVSDYVISEYKSMYD